MRKVKVSIEAEIDKDSIVNTSSVIEGRPEDLVQVLANIFRKNKAANKIFAMATDQSEHKDDEIGIVIKSRKGSNELVCSYGGSSSELINLLATTMDENKEIKRICKMSLLAIKKRDEERGSKKDSKGTD